MNNPDYLEAQDVLRSLRGIVKFNGGIFKSAKQSKFVLKRSAQNPYINTNFDPINAGIEDFCTDCTPFFIETHHYFGAHNGSLRITANLFEIDEYGVRRVWDVRFDHVDHNYRFRAASINKNKTSLIFARQSDEETVSKIAKIKADKDELVAKVEAENVNTKYLGEIGKRSTFSVTITNVHHFDSMYGVVTLLTMKDSDGNTLTWKASKYFDKEEAVGKKINITGSVKEHKEYKGTKQTVLTRCKIEVI